jgi:acetyltransferase-like isoleucine patch superfamily enzyme
MFHAFTTIGENSDIHPTAIICEFVAIKDNVTIGKNTIIGPHTVIESGAKIGDNVTIQPHGVIARDFIIDDNVFIGPHFSCANDPKVSLGEHGSSKNKADHTEYPIHIQEGARLGTRVTVAPGVTIGKNAFVKMNSFVKKDVPDRFVMGADSSWPDDYDM